MAGNSALHSAIRVQTPEGGVQWRGRGDLTRGGVVQRAGVGGWIGWIRVQRSGSRVQRSGNGVLTHGNGVQRCSFGVLIL